MKKNHYTKYLKSGIGVWIPFSLFGCGTIVNGTTQGIGFSSTPSGASIIVNSEKIGVTPSIVNLNRKDTHIIKIELPGYQPFEATLTRSVSGWVWGNILFGGLIGLAVDAVSGGLYKLSPEQLHAEMSRDGASLLYEKDAIYVAITLQPDTSWQKIGTLNAAPAR
ncbi:MAG: PEGA domain-containing protein [Phycisphaerales bacterium]|nr:MAG: PEGA domain-containing protein [Phycisphaerales bacterium]